MSHSSHQSFQKKALQQLIESYTRESGVRELDKKIAKVIRKLACKYAEGDKKVSFLAIIM